MDSKINSDFHAKKNKPALSIIIPCFNSFGKCKDLFSSLCDIKHDDVEIVFVDDGSTDGTVEYLKSFKDQYGKGIFILDQENKGPGGARNHGLFFASGEYVWFVDSDDDFNSEAVSFFMGVRHQGYDFIDFDVQCSTGVYSTIGFSEGTFFVDENVRDKLLERFGRATSKIVKKSVLVENNIFYPENCYYEDNAMNFFYPFHVGCFYKSSIVGYVYKEDCESVTRSRKVSMRFYDRMATASYGYSRVNSRVDSMSSKDIIDKRFISIYLINTVLCANCITKVPGSGWLMALRIMRSYRDQARNFAITTTPTALMKKSKQYCVVFKLLWFFSRLLPSQDAYFYRLHMKAWGKPIKYIY